MAGTATWLEWDGRRLRWRADAASGGSRVELRIDGVVFERMVVTDRIESVDFAYSPTGNPVLEFSLHEESGTALTAAWRVSLGRAAAGNVQQGHAHPQAMKAASTRKATRSRRPVSIVIPVFNARHLVEQCIDSVIRWTSRPANLIVIDDASTDAGVAPLLERYAKHSCVSILRNAENLGYTKSSNLGIIQAGEADVVLLNSDTHVGPRWLDRLIETAYSDESIGTVTAVSDNAGAFSVPEIERFCPIPERWTLEQTQRALLQRVSCPSPELPTGNGFCMFIKRAMLDEVGVLDADAFPSGYGEENDLCQRAERVGYRHVIAGDVLVAHARSASFGEDRRTELGVRGMAVLRQRYPDYEANVGATLFSFARRVLDYRVRRIYADTDGVYKEFPPRARFLSVVAHADRLAAVDLIDPFENFAAYGEGSFHFFRHAEGGWRNVAPAADADALADWLVQWSIECLCVCEDARANAMWRQAAEKVSIPVVDCPISAGDISVRYQNAWNSIDAFRST